jgi:signal transduction histidine kinase
MPAIIEQLLNTLITYPGNLTYHLVLTFAIAGALYTAFNHWRASEFPQGFPMVIGLSLLLGMRLLLFLVAGLIIQGIAPTFEILPLMDRAITAISLVVIIWLWSFPEPSRRSNTASGLLAILTISFLIFSLISWQNELVQWSNLGFESRKYLNQSNMLRIGWEAVSLTFLAIGAIFLVIRRPNSWGIGLSMLVLMVTGHALELLLPDFNSDYAAAVRLGQLAAYPLLLTLPGRFPLPSGAPATQIDEPLTIVRRSYSTESETFRAFMALTTEEDPSKICIAFTRTVSHLMLADVCFLISLDEEAGALVFECGYDLIREQSFPGATFDETVMPVLFAAMERSRTLKLPASSTSPDLLGLARALGIERVGHLIAVPTPIHNGRTKQGVILLSPYSNRAWNNTDEAYLSEAAEALALLAHKNFRQAQQQQHHSLIVDKLKATEAQLKQTLQANNEFQFRIKDLEGQAPQDQDAIESLAALLQAQEEAQETINLLEQEIEHLKNNQSATEPISAKDLFTSDKEKAFVTKDGEGAENDSDTQVDLRQYSQEGETESHAEVVASIAQELRQPMSSIIGYTDLLMAESVGILGTLQMKFLERIRASVERMRSMTDDLVQITAVDGKEIPINYESVQLSEVIDDAIAFTRSQLREKNIVLRVEIPEQIPELYADRDATLQILVHLLQNAGTVTPKDGDMALRVRQEDADNGEHLLLQISDSGGGIPEEDLSRVFSRILQAEKTLISGIGDTGIGLSVAKSLVEAHKGRIWVDTEVDKGSTFSVLMPITPASSPDDRLGGLPL